MRVSGTFVCNNLVPWAKRAVTRISPLDRTLDRPTGENVYVVAGSEGQRAQLLLQLSTPQRPVGYTAIQRRDVTSLTDKDLAEFENMAGFASMFHASHWIRAEKSPGSGLDVKREAGGPHRLKGTGSSINYQAQFKENGFEYV